MRVLTMVGTDHHPFHRLVRWVDEWSRRFPADDCMIQYGTSMPPRHARGLAYVEPDELNAWMDKAQVLVCHGGPTTIVEARRHGRRPIVVPRRSRWGEHVDDHQYLFTNRLAQTGQVLTATTQHEFELLLDAALSDPAMVRRGDADDGRQTAAAVQRFGSLVAGLFQT